MAIWSCLMKRGRVFDFSPVFLSTRQIRALIVTCLTKVFSRVAPDIRQTKPDIRQTKPDIRPENFYMVYSFFKSKVSTKYYSKISKTVKVIEKMSTGCFFVTPFNYSARYPVGYRVSGKTDWPDNRRPDIRRPDIRPIQYPVQP